MIKLSQEHLRACAQNAGQSVENEIPACMLEYYHDKAEYERSLTWKLSPGLFDMIFAWLSRVTGGGRGDSDE